MAARLLVTAMFSAPVYGAGVFIGAEWNPLGWHVALRAAYAAAELSILYLCFVLI